jgi:hypothetical protein
MRHYKLIFLAVLLLGFIGLGVKTVTRAENKLKFKDIQIESKRRLRIKYVIYNSGKRELN